ncbi:hypothetical protein E2C01_091214 [Portunus trituberculatus]|uniref:Uncharacterized protein n=1 Tax=Portunus trituberculatus TaxID=210409 RepID=A0A5B7JDE0_PORTR|nr:hypothetical protein [Portunus trituberculatus]
MNDNCPVSGRTASRYPSILASQYPGIPVSDNGMRGRALQIANDILYHRDSQAARIVHGVSDALK